MVTPIRAIYSNGQLKLLDPVELREGEEVKLTIESLADTGISFDALDEIERQSGIIAAIHLLDETAELSEEEAERLAQVFASDKPFAALIDEDK